MTLVDLSADVDRRSRRDARCRGEARDADDSKTRNRPRSSPRLAPDAARHESQHEPLVDARIRPLLERYVSAVGATLDEIGDGLVELHVAERRATMRFNNRSTIRIAFTLDALERDPDAEIAVVGSPLVEQLVDADSSARQPCRSWIRGARREPNAKPRRAGITVTNVTLGVPRVALAWHRIVRLLARVVVSAGSDVEEHLVESGCFDATTGVGAARRTSPRDASR